VVSCETLRQVVLARERGARAITLRLNSPTLLRTATTRALVPFPPPREALRSRFGFDTSERQDCELAAAELSRAVHAAGEAFAGFHLHHGFAEANSPEVYLAFALAMKALAAKAGVPLPSINLGGGLWTLSFPVLERLCTEIKRAVGPGTCVRFEPGRILSREAGVAVGRVLSARTVGSTRIRLLNLSRACHVRWAHPRLLNVVPAPEGALPKLKKASSGAPRLLCVGPTCYEDDTFPEVLVGEAAEGNGRTLLPEGDTVVFGGITGYSCAWNSSFNGIPPAEVRFV
jgi:diaminopimelate decarboxylase